MNGTEYTIKEHIPHNVVYRFTVEFFPSNSTPGFYMYTHLIQHHERSLFIPTPPFAITKTTLLCHCSMIYVLNKANRLPRKDGGRKINYAALFLTPFRLLNCCVFTLERNFLLKLFVNSLMVDNRWLPLLPPNYADLSFCDPLGVFSVAGEKERVVYVVCDCG